MKKKIVTVIGARPQFIKAAVLSEVLTKRNLIDEIIIHTGQHYDYNMSKVFFKSLKIKKPKYFLGVKNLSHNLMIASMIEKLDQIFRKVKPNGVIVFGDTNSSLSAAISAKKNHIPIFHVESGVRNYDENMPEESNRYLIDRVSSINFCATEQNFKNLQQEGFKKKSINSKIYKSGDVMLDIFKKYTEKKIKNKDGYIVCTIHRESNIENVINLKNIINALNEINKINKVLFFAHPRTKKKIIEKKLKCNFVLKDPIDYKSMLNFMLSCDFVITDSGGLIRESYFAKKKSLSILNSPVWPEIVKQKYSFNVPPIKKKIIMKFNILNKRNGIYKNNIFGNGKASLFIVNKIENFLRGK